MGKFSNLFFKVEDKENETKEKETKQEAVQTQPIQSIQTVISSGNEDAEIKKQLIDALEKANLEGYDYFEFMKARRRGFGKVFPTRVGVFLKLEILQLLKVCLPHACGGVSEAKQTIY